MRTSLLTGLMKFKKDNMSRAFWNVITAACGWPTCHRCFPDDTRRLSEIVEHFGHLKMQWLLDHSQTMTPPVQLTHWPITCSMGTWRLSDLDLSKLHFYPCFTLPNSPHWHLVFRLCVCGCVKTQESSILEYFRYDQECFRFGVTVCEVY